MSVKVGEKAPDFQAESTAGKVALKDYKGKWVVLFFYPLDFTFVCPTEVVEFSKHLKLFKDANTEVLGCSIDSVHVHKAWIKELGGLTYPLISDINKGIGQAYDVLLPDKGYHLRGLFIIDPDGIIRYQLVHDNSVGRSVQEVYRVLKGLQSGGLCPAEWKPGQKTLEVKK